MIYTLTLSPSIDYYVKVNNLKLGEINRTNNEFIKTIFGIVPAINSLWIKVIKYLGGKIAVRYWKKIGMEEIG